MERIPPEVRDAQKAGDNEALRAMGAKGGFIAGALSADRRSQKEEDLAAFMDAQAQIYRISEDGDIVPPEDGAHIH